MKIFYLAPFLILSALAQEKNESPQGELSIVSGWNQQLVKPAENSIGEGYPAFKQYSITAKEGDSQGLLEGILISTNTGMPVQGVKIYIQYGQGTPQLLAISDSKGRVSMRVNLKTPPFWGNKMMEGKMASLSHIYVGNPSFVGAITRVYTITSDTITNK